MRAMEVFLDDYHLGKRDGRYIDAGHKFVRSSTLLAFPLSLQRSALEAILCASNPRNVPGCFGSQDFSIDSVG